MLQDIIGKMQFETDVLAAIIALLSLLVSAYIAFVLNRLSRKFSQNEATRSINERWDSFHSTMLNKETHDLFWTFMHSAQPFTGIGDRAHHIVLMYLNNVHTEYYTYKNKIFRDYDLAYLDKLLAVLVPKGPDVVQLAKASGFDDDFLQFLSDRLSKLRNASTL